MAARAGDPIELNLDGFRDSQGILEFDAKIRNRAVYPGVWRVHRVGRFDCWCIEELWSIGTTPSGTGGRYPKALRGLRAETPMHAQPGDPEDLTIKM